VEKVTVILGKMDRTEASRDFSKKQQKKNVNWQSKSINKIF